MTPRVRFTSVPYALRAANMAGWSLSGNSGTTAGTNFLGTTDDQPLELKVNNFRALRLQSVRRPDLFPINSINLIGGHANNSVAEGVLGGTISGGGYSYFHNCGHIPSQLRAIILPPFIPLSHHAFLHPPFIFGVIFGVVGVFVGCKRPDVAVAVEVVVFIAVPGFPGVYGVLVRQAFDPPASDTFPVAAPKDVVLSLRPIFGYRKSFV